MLASCLGGVKCQMGRRGRCEWETVRGESERKEKIIRKEEEEREAARESVEIESTQKYF